MVACALLPLLPLQAAAGRRPGLLSGKVALAPPAGSRQIGQVSPAAARLGLAAGMPLAEALAICPQLGLLPPDPIRLERLEEEALLRLESAGFRVEPGRRGEAFFETAGTERMHGGLAATLAVARQALGPQSRLAAAPVRLAARTLAGRTGETGDGPAPVLPAGRVLSFLAELPVAGLSGLLDLPSDQEARLFESMERLGLVRLGDLARLPADRVADRLGAAGLRARELARCEREADIRPRPFRPRIVVEVELAETAGGADLQVGLSLLCDRIAARLAAAGLTARRLTAGATLASGGSWEDDFSPRRPTASARVLSLLLSAVPSRLPGPVRTLRLGVAEASREGSGQLEMAVRPEDVRRARIEEAVRQVRAVAGSSGVVRILDVEPESRLPERRLSLTPYPVR